MKSDDSQRAIGKVVSVSADRFVVELHRGTQNFTVVGFDDVHYVALLGSFVVMPIRTGYVIAEIVGLRDRDPSIATPHKPTDPDMGRAMSAKFLDTVPLGILPKSASEAFSFGVSVFPALYTDALYILDAELDRIFDVAHSSEVVSDQEGATRYRSLTVGKSAVFQDYDVKINVDSFFGGHAAVLGNTGSGKSCTVATILQSIFSKEKEFLARGATFVLLDVNGEYSQALEDLPSDIGKSAWALSNGEVNPATSDVIPFRLPHWFMTVEEWELLLRASERTQRPVLRTALGLTSLFGENGGTSMDKLRNHILAACIRTILQGDAGGPTKADRILGLLGTFSTPALNRKAVSPLLTLNYGKLERFDQLSQLLEQHVQDEVSLPAYKNSEFEFDDLEEALELAILYEEGHGNKQIRDYCSQMVTRFKWLRDREEYQFLKGSLSSFTPNQRDQQAFVNALIGVMGGKKKAQLVIIDMNAAEDEVIEVAAAVVSRLLFEHLRRLEPRNSCPVHVILEEAHRYISKPRGSLSLEASRGFERIAKEGRKYGLFLILASQRPSELSATVLSQCSNFIVHRIQNPDDLHHIRQMTPFVSESVLKRLPSLPKQFALIFGSAVNLPTTFRVRDVNPRPKSDDAKIREIWFRPSSDDDVTFETTS